MFEDLLTEKDKDDITWKKSCHNCNHASFILSNFPKKILCQLLSTHKPKEYYCNKWTDRKNS